MSVPNILTNPLTVPPFPSWDSTKANYVGGDCVFYGGQNYVAFGFASNMPVNKRPDLFQICDNGLGIYVLNTIPNIAVANPNGGVWLNMTLLSPPAMPFAPIPSVPYKTGDKVMYPPGSYKYWSVIAEPPTGSAPAVAVSGQPNNISTGIVRVQNTSQLLTPGWQNWVNSDTGTPVIYFPPAQGVNVLRPATTGVNGPPQYWSASAPLKGLPAVPTI